MSITQPPVEPRQPGQASDDVEGLLHDFFHSTLPNPWPAPPTRAQNVLPFSRSSSWKRRARSVLALAASIAILAVTLGLVSGKLGDRSPPGFLHDSPGGTHLKPYKDSIQDGKMHPANK
jgi:hypothetical protein